MANDIDNKTTRQQIVDAADQLFYQNGFEHTSFSDIADAVGISRGNFYYHFKTKDDILDAVIELRIKKTRSMLATWEQANNSPTERIRSFIHMLINNQKSIMQYGCPVGSLCAELAKLNHRQLPEANKLFALFRDWLRAQLTALGYQTEAESFAMHLLMRSQGIATLANAFKDETFVQREVECMDVWLNTTLQQSNTQGAH